MASQLSTHQEEALCKWQGELEKIASFQRLLLPFQSSYKL